MAVFAFISVSVSVSVSVAFIILIISIMLTYGIIGISSDTYDVTIHIALLVFKDYWSFYCFVT
ncbi:hypothetical protein [Candidatus Liberibacter brunswickensis]|uniref:hypothetical protein n=1 Tax=Candidatus Liberibacter brunswickensis TaxID=1968796 RepID=UPI002FE296C6